MTTVNIVLPGAHSSSQGTPIAPSISATTILKMVKNRVNNQNSDLDARSEKLVYFIKHTFTASKKFILVAPSYRTFTKHGKGQAEGGGQVSHTSMMTY